MSEYGFDFCKEIINKSEYNDQYLQLIEAENELKKFDNKYNAETFSNLIKNEIILYQYIELMKKYTHSRSKNLFLDKLITIYNYINYKISIFFKIKNKDSALEKAFILFDLANKLEKECLVKFKSILNDDENITNISQLYLYLISLHLIKKNIDTYYKQQLTINERENFFNINFYNEIDIDKNMDNLTKVKNLILDIKK